MRIVGVCRSWQTAQRGGAEQQIANQRGVHSYARLLHRDNPISEVDRRRGVRPDYLERAALYKALDGQDGRRDWRTPLLDVMQEWLCRFPECASKRQGRPSYGADDANQPSRGCEVSQEDL